jgi:hypothetical protein
VWSDVTVAVAADAELELFGVASSGQKYLSRQAVCLGGIGDIARNVIAERVLNLPRECAPDRGA